MPTNAQIGLRDLFVELFDTSEDLRNFLAYCEVDGQPLAEVLVKSLPGPTVSLQDYVAAAVDGLLRRNLLSEALLNALGNERPGQRRRIEGFAAEVGFSLQSPPRPLQMERPRIASDNPFAPFARFVGRERELAAVARSLREGRSALLIGGRRAGKTALAWKLTSELIDRPLYRADIAAWEGNTEGSLIRGLGSLFGRTCRDREQLKAALQAAAPLSLVLDEAERLLGHPWTNGFLAWLRHLDDTGMGSDLSLLLIGGPELARYRYVDPADPNCVGGSPVLNTSDWIYLDPLTTEARRDLIAALGRPLADKEEGYLLDAVGGHPWLLQQVLDRMREGDALNDALNHVSRHSHAHFQTWERQLDGRGLRLLLELIPAEGVPRAEFDEYPDEGQLCDWTDAWMILRCMCLVEEQGGQVFRGPSMVVQRWLRQYALGRR